MLESLKIEDPKNEKSETEKEFEHNLKRVIRRTYIAANMEVSDSLSELKQKVREYEEFHDIDNIVEKMITGETLEPRMEKFCSELYEELVKKYPYLNGIVIGGSSAHGGGLIRSLVDIDEEDLDWGIIVSNNHEVHDSKAWEKELDTMIIDADGIMEKLSSKMEFYHTITSCKGGANPSVIFKRELIPENIERQLIFFPEDLVFYLQPTFPKEVGEENRKLIWQNLENFRNSYPSDYKRIIEAMTKEWLEMHEIKEKHFSAYATDKRTQALIGGIKEEYKDNYGRRQIRTIKTGLLDQYKKISGENFTHRLDTK